MMVVESDLPLLELSFFMSPKIPVMMGFGIRTAEDVRPMKEIIDGAIVGSHFITLMREHGFYPQAAADYCSTFKKELNEM